MPSITRADVTQYFFLHQLGQFNENMRITRRMNLIRDGKTNDRLMVISLSRDPIDWFRSSLIQDIDGYISILKSIAQLRGMKWE